MRHLMLGAAAFALAASGGVSAQGNGNGKGNGKDRGAPAAAQKGPSQKADRGPKRKAQDRGNARADRGKPGNGNGNANKQRGREDRGNRANLRERADRTFDRVDRRAGQIERRVARDVNERVDGVRPQITRLRDAVSRGLINGCPPGLAKKNNGCTPPGQLKNQRSIYGTSYRPSYFGFGNFDNGRYYYDDGYLMRLGGNGGILGYLPLLGGALSIGNRWPSSYESYALPDRYVSYYGLNDSGGYRYADNVIYRVDPETAAIQSIAALLTGDDFTVGQRVPAGYDVYNVPYEYRERYYDTPDAHYRYSDGYVYRIDPTTQLVAAAIDLLS